MKNSKPMVNLNVERQKDIAEMQNPQNVRPQFKDLSLEECQEYCVQDRLPFDACFLNITSDLNVSTSIRTLHLMGVLRSLNVSASVAMVTWDMVSEIFDVEC